jgi:isoquinoline 1-oxidoreductase beta subunit
MPYSLSAGLDHYLSEGNFPAPPSDAIYGNPGFLGMMYTAGSTAVSGYFDQLRQFGAQVRLVLIDNVARRLGVPAAELYRAPSFRIS